MLNSFSIPCESWGSATPFWFKGREDFWVFQYSLRIVGFRDSIVRAVVSSLLVTFQYSLRIVGFRDRGDATHIKAKIGTFSIPCESWGSATISNTSSESRTYSLSVFPANRGVPRL